MLDSLSYSFTFISFPGADPGFQVRGGTLKKNCAEQREVRKFWGISCEKLRFYAKKSYFSNYGGGANFFGVFHVKNHDFTPKKIIFLPILGGGGGGGVRRVHPPPPPLNPPLLFLIQAVPLL